MSDSLKPLLDLQEVDHTRDRLVDRREKLPEKAELADIERRIADVNAAVGGVQRQIDDVIKDVNHREGELAIIEQKIAGEEKKLYSGAVVNPKELSALQSEIEMLKRRKSPMEEAILERLMGRDEHYAERERLQAEITDLEKEAGELRRRITEATDEIEAELSAEEVKRAAIVRELPEEVLDLYATLRSAKQGTGAGALVDGVCAACHEALPAMELDRIRQAARTGETLFRCVHCRRILVVQ